MREKKGPRLSILQYLEAGNRKRRRNQRRTKRGRVGTEERRK